MEKEIVISEETKTELIKARRPEFTEEEIDELMGGADSIK